jgi:hypothetical protein
LNAKFKRSKSLYRLKGWNQALSRLWVNNWIHNLYSPTLATAAAAAAATGAAGFAAAALPSSAGVTAAASASETTAADASEASAAHAGVARRGAGLVVVVQVEFERANFGTRRSLYEYRFKRWNQALSSYGWTAFNLFNL